MSAFSRQDSVNTNSLTATTPINMETYSAQSSVAQNFQQPAKYHQQDYHQNKQLPIDVHYDKWSRFENFLKFAEKKEVRDRLKELDPPPLSNYVDVQTIDNIKKERKDPKSLVKKADNRTEAEIAAH